MKKLTYILLIILLSSCNSVIVRDKGLYNYKLNKYRRGSPHGQGAFKEFMRGIVVTNKLMVMIPQESLNVGLYDFGETNWTEYQINILSQFGL